MTAGYGNNFSCHLTSFLYVVSTSNGVSYDCQPPPPPSVLPDVTPLTGHVVGMRYEVQGTRVGVNRGRGEL